MNPVANRLIAEGTTAAVLALAQRILTETIAFSLSSVLHDLMDVFQAGGAGLADTAPGGRTLRERREPGEPALPWAGKPIELANVAESLTPLVLGGKELCCLCASAGADRVLWIETSSETPWGQEESAALDLAAQVLGRRLGREEFGRNRAGQQRMEDAVLVARRLAHVYSNVLQSIFGFVEMSLSLAPAGSTLRRYLDVAYRGAQQGVSVTERLRLLGCQATASSLGASLLPALARQIGRRKTPERPIEELVDMPADLPAMNLSTEQITAIFDALLDNAHEALERGGRIVIAARVVSPTPDEVRQTWGRMTPGTFVRLEVTDTGPGLSPETRLRLFRQPFFSTKPRHQGLGLTIVQSIVSGQGGGVSLLDPPSGGLTARVYLPVFIASVAPGKAAERRVLS